MTTEYYGMTPWEYNEWARSRENAADYTYEPDRTIVPRGSAAPTNTQYSTPPQYTATPDAKPVDPYKDIDRSPFELGPNDAIALAQQQRVRDATAYRSNLAGLPQPIELWSGNVADTQRTTPLGTVASLMPGQGSFGDSASLRAYALAREAYMNDPIRAALEAGQLAAQQPAPYVPGGNNPTPGSGSGINDDDQRNPTGSLGGGTTTSSTTDAWRRTSGIYDRDR
jgi:hypothetical protein